MWTAWKWPVQSVGVQGLPSEGVKGVLECEKDQLEEVELGSVQNATGVKN